MNLKETNDYVVKYERKKSLRKTKQAKEVQRESCSVEKGHVLRQALTINYKDTHLQNCEASSMRNAGKNKPVYSFADYLTNKHAMIFIGTFMGLLLYLFLAFVILPELVPDDFPLMGSFPVLKRSLNIVCPNKTRCEKIAEEKVREKLGDFAASAVVNKTISRGGFSERCIYMK